MTTTHIPGACGGRPLLAEHGYRVCVIQDASRLKEAYRLRYSVFSRELGWVGAAQGEMEMDRYDYRAVPIGLYDDGDELVSYIRLILPTGGFMLEDIFSGLVGDGIFVRKESDTVEASRFCIRPDARSRPVTICGRERSISLLLIKGLYRWCLDNRIRYIYAVMEEGVYRFYGSLGIPLVRIGKTCMMPDGLPCGAFILDWRRFERVNSEDDPELVEWFSARLDEPQVGGDRDGLGPG